ncbi:hypothetical protein [Ktedonobacter robiniae]|uniref:hypothetical protein n=1 Tax=Ktedonobacter robiniae TaxID=2778365 RepID=UPI0019152938|nr:hypothetical protein [Ktedonobacter robiniae]
MHALLHTPFKESHIHTNICSAICRVISSQIIVILPIYAAELRGIDQYVEIPSYQKKQPAQQPAKTVPLPLCVLQGDNIDCHGAGFLGRYLDAIQLELSDFLLNANDTKSCPSQSYNLSKCTCRHKRN